MTFAEDTKKFNQISKYKVRCKCSHVILMARVDRLICNHCGNWVYRTPQLEFKYKIKEKLGDNDEQKNR